MSWEYHFLCDCGDGAAGVSLTLPPATKPCACCGATVNIDVQDAPKAYAKHWLTGTLVEIPGDTVDLQAFEDVHAV